MGTGTAAAPPAGPPRALPTRAERAAVLLLVGFLLIFPKGGIKLAGVPITWGYLLLAAASVALPVALLRGQRWRIRRERLLVLLLLAPFQAVVWLGLLFNGVTSVGFTISLLVSLFFVPLVFVLVLGPGLDRLPLGYLFGWIRAGILFVAAYGIFLFFYKLSTGSFIEIPLLTVNMGDVGGLEDKYIDRGGIFKLISTYNNGNIYGVSLLILLPLYVWLEPRTWKHLVVKGSLLLTLSRTVWAGLILFELLHRMYIRPPTLRALAVLASSLALIGVGVWFALDLLGMNVSFLFDRSLGGRSYQWEVLERATLLPDESFEHILEMVYLSVLENFGLIGLATFVLGLAAPLGLHLLGVLPHGATEYKRSLAGGLAIYLFVSLSDGALLFIPVMAFYWFVVSLLLSDNPSFAEAGGRPTRPAARSRGGPRARERAGARVPAPAS